MRGQKRKGGIGELIYEQRIRKNLSEEALSRGLCSVLKFRKIELGKKIAEKTLLDAFFERMGCEADYFSIILEKEEYQRYDLHNRMERAYLTEKTEELQKGIKEFEKQLSEKTGCEYQFYCKMRFLMGKYPHKTVEEMERILIPIIQITVPRFTIQSVAEYSLRIEEFYLCCLLAFLYQKYGEKEKSKILLENLLLFVDQHYQNVEAKVRFYPQIVVLLLQVCDVWTENERWISLCQKAIYTLVENGKMVLMEELLQDFQLGMEEKIRKGQRKFSKIEEIEYQGIYRGLESIREIYQEYGISYGKRELVVSNYGYHEVYLLQEVILDYRMRAKKSQSELGEVLEVEWETISRYENGKNKPSRRNYLLLAKEIGIPYETYFLHLPVGNYALYEKIRQIERFLFRNEFILAEQLFLEIEPMIPKEWAANQQYCIRTKTVLDFYQGRISQKEELQQLEQAIRCTFPNYNEKDTNFLRCHIPSRYEAILLNHIANAYEELGERETAIRILKAVLNAYQASRVKEEYHSFTLSLIIANYSEYLGREGEYDAALEEIENVVKMELQFGRGIMIPYLIYAKGWNLLKREGSQIAKETRNACMKCYQQAYWISELMKDFIIQQKIEQLYKQDFGEKLV